MGGCSVVGFNGQDGRIGGIIPRRDAGGARLRGVAWLVRWSVRKIKKGGGEEIEEVG